MRIALALLLISLAGCATDGSKQTPIEPTRITLLAQDKARPTAAVMQRKPYLELDLKDPGAVLTSKAGSTTSEPPTTSRARTAASEALEKARLAYRNLRFAEALSLLSRAQTELGAVAASDEDLRILSQLLLQRGLNLLALKDKAEAGEAFSTAMHLGYQGPESGQFPPVVEAQITRTREELAGATRGALTLTVQPPGASIWIDGKEQGAPPVTVKLAPGLHHLRITRPGQEPKAFFQQLTAGKADRLDVFLKPLPESELARELLSARGKSLMATGDAGTLKRIFGPDRALLEVEPGGSGGLRATLLWTGAQPTKERCSGPTENALADCLAPRLYSMATGKDPRAAGSGPTVKTPLYRRWWLWTIVAAGVAGTGAGLGIYFGTRTPRATDVDIVSSN
jgi:hypothetical protein